MEKIKFCEVKNDPKMGQNDPKVAQNHPYIAQKYRGCAYFSKTKRKNQNITKKGATRPHILQKKEKRVKLRGNDPIDQNAQHTDTPHN